MTWLSPSVGVPGQAKHAAIAWMNGARRKIKRPFPTGTYFFLLTPFFAVLDLAALDFVALDLTIFFFTRIYSSSFVVVARSIT